MRPTLNRSASPVVLAALLMLLLVCALPIRAYAEDAVELTLSREYDSVNEPLAVSGMLPGDRASTDILVEVRHADALTVRFRAEAVDGAAPLSRALELRLIDRATGSVMYEGTLEALGEAPFSVALPKSEGGLSRLAWRVEVGLPASAGNEHQASRCAIDLHWYVDEVDQAKLAPLAQTGDWLALALAVALACAAVGSMAVWWVRSRPPAKGDAAASDALRRKKSLAVLAAAIALLALAALAWALIWAQARLPLNTFETGTVSIDLNDGRPIFADDEVLLEPGGSVSRDFAITNTGTADAYYRLRLIDAEGGLASSLMATISRDGEVLFEGSFAELAAADACVSDDRLAPGQTDVLTATLRMAEEAGDAYQGEAVSFDLQAQAVQARNNEGRGF